MLAFYITFNVLFIDRREEEKNMTIAMQFPPIGKLGVAVVRARLGQWNQILPAVRKSAI